MPTEKDYKTIEKATIYDLRRIFVNSGKESYTLEELCRLLDTIAEHSPALVCSIPCLPRPATSR